MIRLSIHKYRSGLWAIWIERDDANPEERLFAFPIGTGQTRAAAVTAAVSALEAVMLQLLATPDAIEPRVRHETTDTRGR